MALLTTLLAVLGVLGAMSLLLWVSTVVEARQLGPREPAARPAAAAEPERQGIDQLGTAA